MFTFPTPFILSVYTLCTANIIVAVNDCFSNRVEEVYLHPHLKDVCLHHLLLLLPLLAVHPHKHQEASSQTHGLMNTGLVAPEKAGGARIPGILFLHWTLQRRHRWQPYLKCQLGIFFLWWLKQSVVLCEIGSNARIQGVGLLL